MGAPGKQPFLGSEALIAGAVSRYQLRRRYAAVMPNVYLDQHVTPSLRQRTAAAWLWSRREAVISGLTAAAVHGAKWIDDDSDVELIWRNARAPDGVRTRDAVLLDGETQRSGGLVVTTPTRTAFDLGRRRPVEQAVARLDALGQATGVRADAIAAVARRHPHTRGLRRLEAALDLMDSGAQSPKETWLRLLLIRAGFPRPRTQIPVLGSDGFPSYFLDMGWEDIMLTVEYDGEQHRLNREQYRWDNERLEYVRRVGWTHLRVLVGHREADIIDRVRTAWAALAPADPRLPVTLRSR